MNKKKKITGLVTGMVAIIAVAVFMILGFTTHNWHLVWMVFLAIPLTAIVGDIVTREKNKGDSLIGLVAILAVVVFILLGFSSGWWHIAWVVFLAIPITAIAVNIVRTAKNDRSEAGKAGAEDVQE